MLFDPHRPRDASINYGTNSNYDSDNTHSSPAKRPSVALRSESASRSTASPVASSSTLNHSPPRPQAPSESKPKSQNHPSSVLPLDSTPVLSSLPPPGLAVSATAEWDFDAHPAGPPASSTSVFQCTEDGCSKSYKGKNARSIWKRHLADKHGIGLSSQKKRTRWDSGASCHAADELSSR